MEKRIVLHNNSPYYSQLKDFIIEEIENGNLEHGYKLPSERELAEKYKVSRMTARHALTVLEREGFVERIVGGGGGTFVISKQIKLDSNSTFFSLSKKIRESGFKPESKIIYIRIEPVKANIAQSLGMKNDEDILVIKRLRIADGIPVAIELSQIPYHYCRGIEKYIKKDVSLYQVLEDLYSIKLVRTQSYIRISLSDARESKYLKIKNETACILIESTNFDTLGRKIEFSKTKARGDIVRYYFEEPIE